MKINTIKNHNIVLEDKIVFGNITIKNSEIEKIEIIKEKEDKQHNYILPGFIDQHIHGSNDFDTMDGSVEAILNIASSVVRFGTTSFLPTTMTMPYSDIQKSLNAIEKAKKENKGANILGVNLEGPFISKDKIGAQNPKYLSNIDLEMLKKLNTDNIVKVITFAPELSNSKEFIKYCNKHNIVASIGHTNADFETSNLAIKEGAKLFTHAFNAMSKFDHRNPNVVGSMLLDSSTYAELIFDLIHVDINAIKLLIKSKGLDKVILITDAMRAQGVKQNKIFNLGGQDVIVEKNSARLRSGALAGSILTQDRALTNALNNLDIDLVQASQLLSLNSAKLLKIDDKKGSIKEKKDADLVILDKKFKVLKTIVKGEIVYENK